MIRYEVILPVYVLRIYFYVYRYAYVLYCCQHSTLNTVCFFFLVWRHHLRKV